MGGKVSGFGFCERVESVAGDGSEGLFDIAESFMDLANSLGRESAPMRRLAFGLGP